VSKAPVREPGKRTDDEPVPGPQGPRTPYPVEHPGIREQPGTAPDYVPGGPLEPPGRM
jgi:hypothetical protein